jgi:hypothetical protein
MRRCSAIRHLPSLQTENASHIFVGMPDTTPLGSDGLHGCPSAMTCRHTHPARGHESEMDPKETHVPTRQRVRPFKLPIPQGCPAPAEETALHV